MKYLRAILLLTVVGSAFGAEEEGFVPLFNGRDLTGWVDPNCAPETWSVREGKFFLHRSPHRRAAHNAAV